MNNHISIHFYKCLGCNEKNDFGTLLKILLSHNFVLVRRDFQGRSGPPLVYRYTSVEQYLDEIYKEIELIDGSEMPIEDRRGPFYVSGTGLMEGGLPAEDVFLSFSFKTYGKQFNMFSGSCITTEDKFDAHSEFLRNLCLELYEVLRPSFGHVDYAFLGGGDQFEKPYDYKTQSFYWTTFFGPEFIKKYGKEYFERSPVWRKQTLPDGGMLLQMDNKLRPPKEYIAMEEVKEYFLPIGVEYVTWPNVNLYNW